jgi:hypothetical protein
MRILEIESRQDFQERWMKPYRQFEQSAGREVHAPQWFESLWFRGHGETHRYFASLDENDQVMAVLGMTVYNGMAREFNSAMSPQAYAKRLPAQDLLHWEMILSAKALGCTTFNLSGVDPNPEGKAVGIRQFKEKWGGEYKEAPRYGKSYGGTLAGKILAR